MGCNDVTDGIVINARRPRQVGFILNNVDKHCADIGKFFNGKVICRPCISTGL